MLSSFVFLDFFCVMSSTTSKTISYETAVAIVTSRIPPRYSRRQYQRWVLAEHYCPISDADFDCLVELGLMEKIVALFGETEYNNEWLHQIYDSLYEEENEFNSLTSEKEEILKINNSWCFQFKTYYRYSSSLLFSFVKYFFKHDIFG